MPHVYHEGVINSWYTQFVADSLSYKICFLLFPTETVLGNHEEAIKCVEFCPEVSVLVTGSWDQTVKLWDPRMGRSAGSFSQPDKVSPSSCFEILLIVANHQTCM